jgi:hypothetical protein
MTEKSWETPLTGKVEIGKKHFTDYPNLPGVEGCFLLESPPVAHSEVRHDKLDKRR